MNETVQYLIDFVDDMHNIDRASVIILDSGRRPTILARSKGNFLILAKAPYDSNRIYEDTSIIWFSDDAENALRDWVLGQ